jgi:hypothetical protein
MKNLATVFQRSHPTGSPRTSAGPAIEPLWFEWITLFGLLAFGTWLLGVRGVWGLLLITDPTGLTLVIIVIFAGGTLWCGRRTLELQQQRRLLDAALAVGAPSRASQSSWAGEYWRALEAGGRDVDAPLDVLLESTHGPHSTAWWVNGIQLKLGLLGKVIGFSVLAVHIGQMQNFDPTQSQDLLKSLTTGLGIALLTTMVGLVGNVLLGLQLTRLDRFADALVTDCQRAGMRLPGGRTA